MSVGVSESFTLSPVQIATILQSRETFNDQLDINQNCIDFGRGIGSSDGEPGLSRCDARRDTAAAVALVAAPMPSTVGSISYTLNASTYRGEHSIGLSRQHRKPVRGDRGGVPLGH